MSIPSANIWECNQGAAASNVNGGGFDPTNAGMLTDATATSATGNSPVVSSASYNFVAGDVGHWLYIKAGTNWTPGFYQIASVAANAATLTATIGTADQPGMGGYYANTVAGCATTASPSGGTFSIDYSRSTTAPFGTSLLTSTASTTVTDATGNFTPVMVGNTIYLSGGAGATVGRYSIVTYVSATSLTLDAASGTYTVGVYKTGGALSLASSDDAVFEAFKAGNYCYVKYSGTVYTLGGTVSIAAAGSVTQPIKVWGYNTQRGDEPTGSTRPTFACGAAAFTGGAHWCFHNIIFTGTAAQVFIPGATSRVGWCKAVNTSPTGSRFAFGSAAGNANQTLIACEGISYRGIAFGAGSSITWQGCYAHDSDVCYALNSNNSVTMQMCIGAAAFTTCVNLSASLTALSSLFNNTFVGSTTTKRGTGFALAAGTNNASYANNIFYGFTSGVSQTTAETECFHDYNCFYNNTAPLTNATYGKHDLQGTVDPAFTSLTERSGTTATTNTTGGNHLLQTGATFVTWGIVAGQDYVYVSGAGSGTAVAVGGYGILSVDSETQLTLDVTVANGGANVPWFILQGGNFLPTGAV